MIPRVTIRPAEESEIPMLTDWLKRQTYFERVDLKQMIVFVAEYDGKVVGFIAGRLVWQIEPLALMENFRKNAPKMAQRRATLGLAHAMESWLADRTKNTTGIYWTFAVIKSRLFQGLAKAWGMIRVYKSCGIYAKDF